MRTKVVFSSFTTVYNRTGVTRFGRKAFFQWFAEGILNIRQTGQPAELVTD
jgi:hypothetical protein